jgi:alanyl-tRNA synthetase
VVALLAAGGERLGSAARALRCAPAEVAAAAARAAEDAAARRKDVERLLAVAAEAEAARLAGGQDGPAVKAVLSPPVAGAAAWLKAVGQALAARGRIALLGAVEEGRAHLGFTRPRGEGPHLGQALQAAVALLGGKGGGAPDAAQGSGPAIGMLEAALGEAARRVSGGG